MNQRLSENDIPITFAIITDGTAPARVSEIISSIERNKIPQYEILIIGGDEYDYDRAFTKQILYDDKAGGGWITRKKNIATKEAQYNVIVYLHDYHVFDNNWYEEFCKFGLDWDIQMNQILMINGYRMFDWLTVDHPHAPCHTPIPYHRHDLIQYQYISGGYWIAKKHVGETEPQNENLGHHQAEDLDWSLRVRNKFKIAMNPNCVVRHNKIHRENETQKNRMIMLGSFFGD